MSASEFALVTPGEMLKEEFVEEYGLSQNRLAKAVGISRNRIAVIPIPRPHVGTIFMLIRLMRLICDCSVRKIVFVQAFDIAPEKRNVPVEKQSIPKISLFFA